MNSYTLAITKIVTIIIFSTLLLITGCASTSKTNASENSEASNKQPDIEKALRDFNEQIGLEDYFKRNKGIAILPQNIRAGAGFGGAVGWGWLVVEGKTIGRIRHQQLSVGAYLGIQKYRQILFFKTDAALEKFKAGTFEFAGQANATALIWGKGWTPSYGPDTALFTLIDGGLLLEGSVGAHRYAFFPN